MGERQSSPLQEGNPRAIGAEYGRLDRSRIRIGKEIALLEAVRIFRGRGTGVVRNRVEDCELRPLSLHAHAVDRHVVRSPAPHALRTIPYPRVVE